MELHLNNVIKELQMKISSLEKVGTCIVCTCVYREANLFIIGYH